MNKEFRNKLLKGNMELEKDFSKLMNKKELYEIPLYLQDIINKDKTPIRINGEPLALKDLFHQGLTEGRCEICAFELVLLLDKFHIYSEAVRCINDHFIGTNGSTYGGHWYVEIHFPKNILCVDTSLVIAGSEMAFKRLGHKIERKCDIDTLFKEHPNLIDYYDNMVVNKTY